MVSLTNAAMLTYACHQCGKVRFVALRFVPQQETRTLKVAASFCSISMRAPLIPSYVTTPCLKAMSAPKTATIPATTTTSPQAPLLPITTEKGPKKGEKKFF
jgi:hypothetical protein